VLAHSILVFELLAWDLPPRFPHSTLRDRTKTHRDDQASAWRPRILW